MAKSVRFTGDANTGLGKFSVFEGIGGFDAAQEQFNESIPCDAAYETQVTVAAGAVDQLVDISPAANAKKVLLKLSAPATVKLGTVGSHGLQLTGVTVLGGGINHLYVSALADVTIAVLAGV